MDKLAALGCSQQAEVLLAPRDATVHHSHWGSDGGLLCCVLCCLVSTRPLKKTQDMAKIQARSAHTASSQMFIFLPPFCSFKEVRSHLWCFGHSLRKWPSPPWERNLHNPLDKGCFPYQYWRWVTHTGLLTLLLSLLLEIPAFSWLKGCCGPCLPSCSLLWKPKGHEGSQCSHNRYCYSRRNSSHTYECRLTKSGICVDNISMDSCLLKGK